MKQVDDVVDDLRGLMDDPTKKMILQLNLATGAIGLGLLVVGVMGFVHPPKYSELIPSAPVGTSPIIAASLGLAILLVSIFGVAGSLAEKEILVYLYGTLFALVSVGVALMGAFALYALILATDGTYLAGIKKLMSNYTNETKDSIDRINRKFKCCGLEGFESWPEFGAVTREEMNTSLVMPASCCEGTDPILDKNSSKCTRDHATYVICDDLVVREQFTMALYSFSTAFVLIGFFCFVIICSCFLATELG